MQRKTSCGFPWKEKHCQTERCNQHYFSCHIVHTALSFSMTLNHIPKSICQSRYQDSSVSRRYCPTHHQLPVKKKCELFTLLSSNHHGLCSRCSWRHLIRSACSKWAVATSKDVSNSKIISSVWNSKTAKCLKSFIKSLIHLYWFTYYTNVVTLWQLDR